jgi:3-(3-hydroxy-phenyl)propionate hydroxylase
MNTTHSTPYEASRARAGEVTPAADYALAEHPFTEPAELHSGELRRHPVVIVGAGITGLTLACGLAKLGVPTILLEEDSTVGIKGASSCGICYTQKSLEIFDRLGIYERIAAKGIQWSVSRTFAGKDEVYSFDLRHQSSFGLSRQPPFINLQQFYIEGYLVERIAELGHVDLRWKSRVTGLEQHDGYATLSVDTPAGPYRLEATHVIDASGSHTPFHGWCGASMTSRRGDDLWCIVDVRFKHRPPQERHTWIEAPFNGNRAVWQHLMADDVWRIDYQMEPNADPEASSSLAQVRERLRQQFGPDVQYDIVWVGAYNYRSQCLDQLRIGSVFFMGDAAKIVSPFGARGGNTGVADADNLAWKLAAVLQGRAPASLLESYHEERHEAAAQNVMVTNRTARFLRPASAVERSFRTAAISLARQYPFARPIINTGRMAVANSYTQSGICDRTGGLSVQNVAFTWGHGKKSSQPAATGVVNDLLDWAGGDLLVLVFGDMSADAAKRLRDITSSAPVRAVQVLAQDIRARAVEHVRDPLGHLQGACHVFGHAWALVRPDGYLAATGESVDTGLIQAISQALGIQP